MTTKDSRMVGLRMRNRDVQHLEKAAARQGLTLTQWLRRYIEATVEEEARPDDRYCTCDCHKEGGDA